MILNVENLTHGFGDRAIFNNVSFRLLAGEHIGLVGANGEGKSTFMNIVTGTLAPDEGKVEWNKHVRVGYLDQHAVLEKGMTIESVLKSAFSYLFEMEEKINQIYDSMADATDDEIMEMMEEVGTLQDLLTNHDFYMIDAKTEQVARALGLLELGLDHDVTDLSGGQRTKVLLAKLLLEKPEILLLDEPLGALDLKMRKEMQLELKEMHERLGITFIYVTHDQEEALTMSDKIVVMSEGRIQQIGTPEDIYNEPKNAFVADFIGESNIFNGIMTGKLKVRFCGAEFECLDDVEHGTQVDVVVRPEDILIVSPEQGAVKGTVISVVFKGVHYEITVQSGKNEIVIQSTKSAKVGDMVGLNVEPDGIHVMPAEKALNRIETGVDKYYKLEFLDGELECDLSKIVPSSHYEDGVLMDASGDVIDHERLKVILTIKPDDITMSDDQEEGIISGHIINLIYKGDHYSYVVRTENEEDFIVHDEYLWNMDDFVSLVIPKDKIHFELKK